eukprot:14617186-Alexandrium_andersonii.AAC.1
MGFCERAARARGQSWEGDDRPDLLRGRLPPRASLAEDLLGGSHHPGGVGAPLALAPRCAAHA